MDGVYADIAHEPAPESAIPPEAQARYRVWKKNAVLMYLFLSTTTLTWPSLSVQWFPDFEETVGLRGWRRQRLCFGLYTAGQMDEHLQLGQIEVLGAPGPHTSVYSVASLSQEYDAERGEVVPRNESLSRGIQVLQKIQHAGEVNRLRIMPANPDVVATVGPQGHLSVFDRTKHALGVEGVAGEDRPVVRVAAHGGEAWGLLWNQQREGVLALAGMDGVVCVWDLTRMEAGGDGQPVVRPCSTLVVNSVGVNGVEWLPLHHSVLVLAGEDGHVRVHDVREGRPLQSGLEHSQEAVRAGVNSVLVSPHNNQAVVAGDSEGVVRVWDLRRLAQRADEPVTEHQAHTGTVAQVGWNPSVLHVYGLCGEDALVRLWRSGATGATKVFEHGGHMLAVNDFDWNVNDAWMVASVADDNTVHVWRASDEARGAAPGGV